MEAADFVGDSDSDELELLDALEAADTTRARELLDEEEEQKQAPEEEAKPPGDEHTDGEGEEEAEPGQIAVLEAGTLVEVDSRTWPGINKPGGSGRVVKVHREEEQEEVFYDVRYVLGGFEKHIASEYVKSSKLLEQQSNREPVAREFYHDGFINEPHKRKQEEAARKRDRAAAHPDEKETQHHKRRMRSHRSAHAVPTQDKEEDEVTRSNEDHGEGANVKLSDDAFILKKGVADSLEMSSPPPSDQERSAGTPRAAQTPTPKKPTPSQRRQKRIIISSDEESSDDAQPTENNAHKKRVGVRSEDELSTESGTDQAVVERRRTHHPKRRKKRPSKTKRYVGGYVHDGEDPDATFIQPEDNSTELPEDVIRSTGLQLATTKKGLKAQLRDIYNQQLENMTVFHKQQREVNQKVKKLATMSFVDLGDLYKKVNDMKTYITKTLVNRGEDAMNTIMGKLSKKNNGLPEDLELLELGIEEWKIQLNLCAPWARHVQDTVENAFLRRNEPIPFERVAQAEYSSDSGQSSYSADDLDGSIPPTENDAVDMVSDEIDLSYEYDTISEANAGWRSDRFNRDVAIGQSGTSSKAATGGQRQQKITTSTTLDDYYPRRDHTNRFQSNFRLIGRQRNIAPSDPRFNWSKLARKQQQRTHNRFTGVSSIQHSKTFESTQRARSTNLLSLGDSSSVQARRMQLRDKRFRSQPTKKRIKESFFARPTPNSVRVGGNQTPFPSGIPFEEITPEKRSRLADPTNPSIHPDKGSNVQPVNWETIFEAISDGSCSDVSDDSAGAARQTLLEFGHPICGPSAPRRLFCNGASDFENLRNFDDVVVRRVSCLRQLMNGLRLQETEFMESLAREGISANSDEGYLSSPEWRSLVSLEEAYHTTIASFAAQLLEGLEGIPPSALPDHVETILEQVGALIRQLPDCESLFGGCKAYFFYFEVASRAAKTTPLLTAISRAYWYCLHLLAAVKSTTVHLVQVQTPSKTVIDDLFLKMLPVNRVNLAAVLFLFDLYLYLPSSHRIDDEESDGSRIPFNPALSLWILVRDCSTSTVQSSHQESLVAKAKDFWALVRTVYRERYFDELARCFVRGESSGGYLRDFTPKADNSIENRDEVLESQLLASEAMWDLLALLSQICSPETFECGEAASEAKWTVVKELLHRGKRDFLPFQSSFYGQENSSGNYQHHSKLHTQHVLKRILKFSKLWRPSKDVVEIIMQRVWETATLNLSNAIVELPVFMKQYVTQCRELENSLTAVVESSNEDDEDSTTLLCKIIWVQLLKLEKRVHRGRFRRSILNAIPSPPGKPLSSAAAPTSSLGQIESRKDWNWGKDKNLASTMPATATPAPTAQPSTLWVGTEKERTATSILLIFAIVGICIECGGEQKFSNDRTDKDIKYLEREVDFYCKEILRWTSGKPESEVISSQALYALGALLLEKNSTEFPTIFGGLNARLESSMKNLQKNPLTRKDMKSVDSNTNRTRDLERRRRRLQSAALSPLYQMRDLTRKLIEAASSSTASAYAAAVEKSLENILSTGLEACLNGAIHKTIALEDLQIAIEIFQLVLPRAQDEPKQYVETEFSMYDDFDDQLALCDMDDLLGRRTEAAALKSWSVEKCRPKVVQLVNSNLRVVLQQLVLNYPQGDGLTFDELYAIDLLGMMISTCEIQFYWSNVTSNFVKPRNLAPRVLSAALKYNPEKEWLNNVFLRDKGADQEVANAWLMGTLDVLTLNPRPIVFKCTNAPFSIESATAPATKVECWDSNYWVVLTDGIIHHLLRQKPDGFFYNIDPQLLQLLRGVASTCKFPAAIRENVNGLHDVGTLYDLHLDVFQAFCRSAGTMWQSFNVDPSKSWQEMNQFRLKTMNPPSGIFVSFLESYKLNFRRACGEIDQVNHNWYAFAKLFLRQAGENTTSTRSYHDLDDTIKSFDDRLTGLTTTFRFMYQCMDAFLFYCGEMAIGDTNLFFNAMELLFRQVSSTEYAQATKRLASKKPLKQRSGVRDLNAELQKGFCPQAMTFVNSVQLFFARQKYPSLLHWFAQTSEIYQTFKGGWSASPLRTLLLNILDPDGPLGIHSYYPDDLASSEPRRDIRVGAIRREAFYLSCGLFNCKCTKAFEHSRSCHAISSDVKDRLKQLRGFVLNDFVRDSLDFAVQEGGACFLETMVPLCQFVRAVLNHANLNLDARGSMGEHSDAGPACEGFELGEIYGCLELIAECLIKSIPTEEAINSTISCVLTIELCGILGESIAFNDHRPLLELIDLVKLVVCYLRSLYMALSDTSTKAMDPLFASSVCVSPAEKLCEHRFTSSDFRDIIMEKIAKLKLQGHTDSYDINLVRTRLDVLATIRQVMERCKSSSDERLRSFTM